MNLKKYIAEVKDFPTEDILFRDITPLMADGAAFKYATDALINYAHSVKPDVIVGPEARGFIFGCPVAYALGIGFAPIRKPGKLPRETVSMRYDLEYGTNELCMHKDAIKPGQRVLIIDDLLATGGTVDATVKLIESNGGIVVGIGFLIELTSLKGSEKLKAYNYCALMQYE